MTNTTPNTTTNTTTSNSPQAPALNGQIIGQAERTTRAVLERLLSDTDTPFHQWVALNLLGNEAHSEAGLVDHLAAGLLIDHSAAESTVDAVRSNGLIDGIDPVVLTADGQARFATITAGIADISARLYSDLPHDDLVVARRVLETLTERARAALAA